MKDIILKYIKLFESLRSKTFSWEDFKQTVLEYGYGGACHYVAKHLQELGKESGSSRRVFLLSSKKVLKVAKNRAGLAQNKAEITLYESTPEADILFAKIYDYDKETQPKGYGTIYTTDDPVWIVAELVKPVRSTEEFETLAGFSVEDLNHINYDFAAWHWWHSGNEKEASLSMKKQRVLKKTNPFYAAFKKIVLDKKLLDSADLMFRDYELYRTPFGKTADGRLVILDYGFTPKVRKEHY